MKDRIKIIRKYAGMTQQQFADTIGVKRNTVTQYEMGRNDPIDTVISIICMKFDVNEDWLRYGTGDMHVPVDRKTQISRLTKKLLDEEEDSIRNRFASVLCDLTQEQLELLADIAESFVNGKK